MGLSVHRTGSCLLQPCAEKFYRCGFFCSIFSGKLNRGKIGRIKNEKKLSMQPEPDILSIREQQPLIIGIGNRLRGDDGAGVILAEELAAGGYSPTLIVHGTPENYLRKIAEMSETLRLWVDVINWNASPGEFRVFTLEDIGQYAVSTHNFSPVVLVEYLNSMKAVPDVFLGIQPRSLSLGSELSGPVARTVRHLTDYFLKKIKQSDEKQSR